MPRKKATFDKLYIVLKKELKARSITYRDVADALNTTQSSIKMRFTHRNLSVVQLIAISELLGMTLTEVMRKVEFPDIQQLTYEQEITLVSDIRLLWIFMLVMDDCSLADIISNFDISEAECIKHLLTLDRLRLIDLLPNNVIRRLMQRGSAWQPNGPLQNFLLSQIGKYLDSRFDKPHEKITFARARLTTAAISALHTDMLHLQNRMEEIHNDCRLAPVEDLHYVVMLIAQREWELPVLKEIRLKLKRPKAS